MVLPLPNFIPANDPCYSLSSGTAAVTCTAASVSAPAAVLTLDVRGRLFLADAWNWVDIVIVVRASPFLLQPTLPPVTVLWGVR